MANIRAEIAFAKHARGPQTLGPRSNPLLAGWAYLDRKKGREHHVLDVCMELANACKMECDVDNVINVEPGVDLQRVSANYP